VTGDPALVAWVVVALLVVLLAGLAVGAWRVRRHLQVAADDEIVERLRTDGPPPPDDPLARMLAGWRDHARWPVTDAEARDAAVIAEIRRRIR
jgi:hypothetical protein